MNNIAQVINKHISARLFLAFSLTLAMALLVGSGLRLPSGSNSNTADKAGTSSIRLTTGGTAQTAADTTASQSQPASSNSSELYVALRNMSNYQRDQLAASDGKSATSNQTTTSAPASTGKNDGSAPANSDAASKPVADTGVNTASAPATDAGAATTLISGSASQVGANLQATTHK
ncbi:MAG TPA: hypothetical protein VH186_18040 [Chloroflexia bacterium]|nr:hypothetical protein [Chloroflexia bacterium]